MTKHEPLAVGIDIGTTTITSLALGLESGRVVTQAGRANDAEITSAADRRRGRSEWGVERIFEQACRCLREVCEHESIAPKAIVGLGVTGQQHGGLVVDPQQKPLTPLIGWQDRRLVECKTGGASLIDELVRQAGESYRQTGCRLAPGFLAGTLAWLRRNDCLPRGTGVFVTDLFAARLASPPEIVSDPTNAGGSGVYDLQAGRWHDDLIEALDLPTSVWPKVGSTGDVLGHVTTEAARMTGLPSGLPVSVALGDHQAAYLGSVGDRERSVLVNVGTGGQVGAYCESFTFSEQLETRPFPRGGYLLVSPGLCGGRTFATLDRFFCDAGQQLFGAESHSPLYDKLIAAAEQTDETGGLLCNPLFTGTRIEPMIRGSWTRVSPDNLTVGGLVRSLLQGMAKVYGQSAGWIEQTAGRSYEQLVGSGNGLRENKLLTEFVSNEFGRPLAFPRLREEAALGAALTATIHSGFFNSLPAASRWLQRDSRSSDTGG